MKDMNTNKQLPEEEGIEFPREPELGEVRNVVKEHSEELNRVYPGRNINFGWLQDGVGGMLMSKIYPTVEDPKTRTCCTSFDHEKGEVVHGHDEEEPYESEWRGSDV